MSSSMVNSTDVAISTPPPSSTVSQNIRSFLDLPAELRCMVYENFTPDDQYTWSSEKPAYDSLLRTCKKIRIEAPNEIQNAANQYYRAYEADWLSKEGYAIQVEPIVDPCHVTVVLSHDIFESEAFRSWRPATDHKYHVPLASLKLKQLTFKVSPNASTSAPPPLDYVDDTSTVRKLLVSILASVPRAERIYFHRGILLSGRSKDLLEKMRVDVQKEWWWFRNQEEREMEFYWKLTTVDEYRSLEPAGYTEWSAWKPKFGHFVLGFWADRCTSESMGLDQYAIEALLNSLNFSDG